MKIRNVLAAFLILVILAAGRADEGSTEVPYRVIRELERAAAELSKKGRADDVTLLIAVIEGLGAQADKVEDLRQGCADRLAKARGAPGAAPRAAKHLRKAAASIEKLLADAGEKERRRLARLVIRLDGECEAARVELGHVRHEGRWVPAGLPKLLLRRAEIAEALRQVRRLTFPIERGESSLPVFASLYGEPGRSVRFKQISMHSHRFSYERLERILRETLRAVALASWFHTGSLELEVDLPQYTIAAIGSTEDYQRAVEMAAKEGGIDPATAARAKGMAAFTDRRGYEVHWSSIEAHEEAGLFSYLYYDFMGLTLEAEGQPCLVAGVVSWICLSHLGTRMPGFLWTDRKAHPVPDSRTVTEKEIKEYREMLRLSEAGIAGSRAWIAYLAGRREDPPWSAAMKPYIGQISGDSLLKTTFVTEYLFETGEFPELFRATRVGAGTNDVPALMEKALGESLASFEERWRTWILPLEAGLAERVEESPEARCPPDAARLMKRLGEIRREAANSSPEHTFEVPKYDAAISRGCRDHALYLAANPEQLAAWPDAHEEYPDKEGFTPAGSLAGLSSVIAPGSKTPEEALEGWMGTYFHRLPILDPGLLRVGWALEKKIAVLDTGSFVAPPEIVTDVTWPPAGARNVPTKFRPELPNPYPGQDQSAWGYPITIQLFHHNPVPKLGMELRRGKKDGPLVPCLLSTPNEPGNPELVPRTAFCLIPKSHLTPNTTYTVIVTGLPENAAGPTTWSFRTGGD